MLVRWEMERGFWYPIVERLRNRGWTITFESINSDQEIRDCTMYKNNKSYYAQHYTDADAFECIYYDNYREIENE